MYKIYLDYYAGSLFTFPLDKGPEPEGTTDVDPEGLSPGTRSTVGLSPPAGVEGTTSWYGVGQYTDLQYTSEAKR